MSSYPIHSYPLLCKPKCPHCGYEPVDFSYVKNEQGVHAHTCWKCKREYRIMEFVTTSYLCMPIPEDEAVDV